MSEVGALIIRLQAETAQFRDDLGKVKSNINDLKGVSSEAGGATSFSMLEARGSVQLLGREFGVAMPREISRMIATIPGVGVALEALLPIMGVVFAATMIYKWVEANEKAAKELQAAWSNVGKVNSEVMDSLGDKMLQVGIKADDLAGNHIAALAKELKLVDRQTMTGIIGEIDKMGKAADEMFGKMQSNWFMQLLMGRADVGPAKDELASMIAEIDKLRGTGADPRNTGNFLGLDIGKVTGEIDSLQAKIKGYSAENAGARQAGSAMASDADDSRIAGARQQLDLEKQNLATLQQMKDAATQYVASGKGEKNNDITAAANAAAKTTELWQKAFDKQSEAGAKAANKLKHVWYDLGEEQEKRQAASDAFRLKGQEETSKQMEAIARREQGLASELASIDDEQIKRDAIRKDLAAKGDFALHKKSAQQVTDIEAQAARDAGAEEAKGWQAKINALYKGSADYEAKLAVFEARKNAALKKGEDQGNAIVVAAAQKQAEDIKRAEEKMYQSIASNVAKSIVENQNLGASMLALVKTTAEAMIQNLIMMELTGDREKLIEAKRAFRNAMGEVPYPLNLVVAPMMFAATMAMAEGGLVPGSGTGDTVPAMLTPGESVVTRALTDRVAQSEGKGGGHIFQYINKAQYSSMDAEGMDKVLAKHNAVIQWHITSTIRRMNKS